MRIPKPKPRNPMPPPSRAIPDPRKEAERKACRKPVRSPDEENAQTKNPSKTHKP